jgi:hypothetical protein
MGTYTRQSGSQATLIVSQTNTLFTVETSQAVAFEVNYTITRVNSYRTGTLSVASNSGSGDPTVSDEYVQNGDTGIILSVSQIGTTVLVNYQASDLPADNGTINYSITYLI